MKKASVDPLLFDKCIFIYDLVVFAYTHHSANWLKTTILSTT